MAEGIVGSRLTRKIISTLMAFIFAFGAVMPAHSQNVAGLLVPGTRIALSPHFEPPILIGLEIKPDNPLFFNFMIDTGEQKIASEFLKQESLRLIKYFMAGLTIPEEDLWVNLSPFEKDRIMPPIFGTTELGRDMLSQDYLLKQLASSLSYPEEQLGKEFWSRVYQNMSEKYGTTDIDADTFNKVWITPGVADIYMRGNRALITDSRLKVMIEEDYPAFQKAQEVSKITDIAQLSIGQKQMSELTAKAMRELIIPEIDKEVNQGERFVRLRQIYHSLILAVWFKRNLRKSIWEKVYIGKNKVDGVDVNDKQIKEKIYQQYLEALRKGVYNYIHEAEDLLDQGKVARKYFSGGVDFGQQVENNLVVSASLSLAGQELLGMLVDKNRIAQINATVDFAEIVSTEKEGILRDRHSFVYSGAEYKDGKVVGGVLVNEQGCANRLELNKVLENHPGFTGVISNVLLNKSGGMGRISGNKSLWDKKKGYGNALVTFVMENGRVSFVYDDSGKAIFSISPENIILMSKSGDKGGFSSKKELNLWFEKNPGFTGVVEKFQLTQSGGLTSFNGKNYWDRREGYANATVRITMEKGEVTAVNTEENELLYPYGQNFVYVNAVYMDGKIAGGSLINPAGAFDRQALNRLFESNPNFSGVVDRVKLSSDGGLLNLNGATYWHTCKGMGDVFVTLVMQAGEVTAVYMPYGKSLYPFQENFVYAKSLAQDGSVVKGELLTKGGFSDRRGLNKWLQDHPGFSGVISRVRLNQTGGLMQLNGRNYWTSDTGFRNALVEIEMENGVVRGVRDEQGYSLYPRFENIVYKDAKYEGGKPLGGMLLDKKGLTNRKELDDFMSHNPQFTGVIRNVRLQGKGALTQFNGRDWWAAASGYDHNSLVNLEMINGEIIAAYGEGEERLYPFSENLVYSGARYEGGAVISGKLVNDRRLSGRIALSRFMQSYKYFSGVIDKVKLDSRGGLDHFLGQNYWPSLEGYENAWVSVVMKEGVVERVYDQDGKELYPFAVNYVYKTGHFQNGSFIGEGLLTPKGINNRAILNDFLLEQGNFTGLIDRLPLLPEGRLGKINRITYDNELKGVEKDLVIVRMVDGRVVEVYTREGQLIWSEDRDRQAQKILNDFLKLGEFQKLVDLFGEDSTNRIIFAFLGNVTPNQIIKFSQQHKKKYSNQRKRQTKPSKDLFKLFLKNLSDVSLFSRTGNAEFEQILKNEAFRVLYKFVVQDHMFLKLIEEESGRQGVNLVLKSVFENILDTFERIGNFKVEGIRESTKFKFYQKYGVKFILDKKRVLLADKPGLGKTIQALGAAVNAFEGKGAQKVLIVCPRVAMRDAWGRQIERHLKGEQNVFMIKERHKAFNSSQQQMFNEARFYVVNYEMLQGERGLGLRESLKKQGIDFIIVDEAHRIRNDNEVSESVLEFDAPYKVLLTASAQKGRTIGKIFNLLYWLYPEKYADRTAFLRQYNSTTGFRQLRMEIQEFTLRRHNEDVLMDMPEFSIEYRPVRLVGEQARLYRIYEQNLLDRVRDHEVPNFYMLIRSAVDSGLIKRLIITDRETGEDREIIPGVTRIPVGDREYQIFTDNGHDAVFIRSRESVDPEQYVEFQGKKGEIEMNGKFFDLELQERESVSAKYEALDGIVADVVAKKQKNLVIFSGIVQTVNDLKVRYAKKGFNVLSINGDTNHAQRDRILKEFKSSQEPTILICTYQTLGESVDLTCAHYGVLVDSPWQDRDQTVGRLYRIGQEQEVHFYILQAMNTIDDHIEQVNWEADMIRKIVLDDVGSVYKSQEALSQLYLSSNANRQNERSLLQRFQERVNVIATGDGTERVEALVTEIQRNNCDLKFDGRLLSAHLKLIGGKAIKFKGIESILKNVSHLDLESQEVMKDFIIQRLNDERSRRVRIKDKLLWYFLKEIVPGFEDIDYDGHLEFIVELGGFILQKLIEDPLISKEEIQAQSGEVSERLFEETMYYLDTANIFKLLSLMGVLPQTYYYEGKLMKYDSPVRIYYTNGGIRYYDEKIVDRIAPAWRVPDSMILERESTTELERDSARVRLLDEAEEKRLANQLRLGNRAAGEALIGSYIRDVLWISTRAVKKAELILGYGMRGAIPKEDLYEDGLNALSELVLVYAEHEIYVNTTLKQYLRQRLGPRLYSLAFKIGKQARELKMDQSVSEDGSLTMKDEQRTEVTPESEIEADQVLLIFRKLLGVKGFSSVEADLLVLFTYEGYTEEDLVAEVAAKNLRLTQGSDREHIKEMVKKFQLAMNDMGRGGILSFLQDGDILEDDDNAMGSDDLGGVDMRSEILPIKITGNDGPVSDIGSDMEHVMFDEASFKGLSPVILNIMPVTDISVLIQ